MANEGEGTMKKYLAIALAAVLLISLIPTTVMAGPEGTPDANRIFKMNIIGVPKGKSASLDGDNGARIFVNLGKTSESVASAIWLEEGDDFEILDANGTDEDGATFMMPPPGYDAYNVADPPEGGVWSDYSIYIRSLGKPGGWATITTCADLLESGLAEYLSGDLVRVMNREGLFGGLASVEQVGQEITQRPKGKSLFTNVTAALTSIVFEVVVDMDGDLTTTDDQITEYVRVPIFDDMLSNEYWEYDNHGLKLLQVWIYDNSTDITLSDEPFLPDE